MFSDKQESFIYESDAFINVADGPVRSGKTFASLFRFGEFALRQRTGDLMIVGKTERTIKRNVIAPMMDVWGPKRIRYVQGSGEVYLKDRLIYVVGANDERAEEKIRGLTGAGAYCNELTLYPENVFSQLIDRCSEQGAQIFADTNPDSPFHWLAENFLFNDEALLRDVKRFPFELDDNPALDPEYKARLFRLHSGLWLKRMVYGLWVIAEGAVYDMFDPEGPMVVDIAPDAFDEVLVGVDYGTANATAFIPIGRAGNRWYAFDEYVHDSRKAGRQKTDDEYSRDLQEFVNEMPGPVRDKLLDPSAASFKTQLKRHGVRGVRDADNDVLDGIRDVSAMLNTGRLLISSRCKSLLKSLGSYVWDPKAQERGEDKPVKKNDHEADALRYAVRRAVGGPGLTVVGKPAGF